MLSNRLTKLNHSPSAIIEGFVKCKENPYSRDNTKGYLNFGIAENHLMNDKLLPKINHPLKLDNHHIQYNDLHGLKEVRQTIKNFLENFLALKELNSENIVIQTGLSAVCESMSFAFFDKGDRILIPTPYYTGFNHDFTKRFECEFEQVHLHPDSNFAHNIKAFEETYLQSPHKDKIKAVLITHPHNPTGEVLLEEFMNDIISFCKKNHLALISDEIYALSNHQGQKHISLYQKAKEAGVDAHFLYGLAKDFSLAGLKVGIYYHEDQKMAQAMQSLSYFHPVSTHTQLLVQNILADTHFLKEYIPLNQKRLKEIPLVLETQLPMYKFIPTDAGLFMLLDLSEQCKDFAQEKQLYEKFLNYIKINMTPGEELGLKVPGFFRVCFARPKEEILEFIVRMKLFYENELS